ncbi:DEAD/DEAH box helicase [Bacillus lacus]|uniref:DEAD/DEAH box helicase n=1 Tax=Metabacillus lacus TaxID=1983721 RepID=A0A7X2IYK6_9BACI|nr:DEAD/DEAH box helicase [Metabacillus lacus]MRX72180.1 DEAD/DEAH box helicase [Metabacillus lacus]
MKFILSQGKLLSSISNHSNGRPISTFSALPHLPLTQNYPFSQSLQSFLYGRKLLMDELPFPLEEIQTHYENGYISYGYGVIQKGRKAFCCRCGNEEAALFASFPCSRCNEDCTYCRSCLMMGRVSECTPLLTWRGPQPSEVNGNPALAWNGVLSPGQQTASSRMVSAIKSRSKLLIWAVCGAGKTEILFEGIEYALQKGLRVCIATPRTDVVLEIAPRLAKVFPGTKVAALYGGSEDRFQHAPLTISTTHQLLRFQHSFDVLVIDEVDAFPYSADITLHYAANAARKEKSALIYLSATPDKALQRQASRGKLPFVKIPRRFHHHPLPVPFFYWCGNWKSKLKQGKLPNNLLSFLETQQTAQKPLFLFVPTVKTLSAIVPVLKKLFPAVEGVHSQDPQRKEKVESFREGKVTILVTTTILERGVTVPFADVAVLGAEDDIFTESALVQISGRVGRHPDCPDGKVYFYHYGKTENMIAAKKHIERMNDLAQGE